MTEDGNWFEIIGAPPSGGPALFLDRDGVLIEERDYLADPDGVALLPGVADCVTAFRARGFSVVVVTNQSGIGRGLFGWPAFHAVNARIAEFLRVDGVGWDMMLACPFHPTTGTGRYARDDSWRKPNPGMIAFAAETLAIDLPASIIVGDKCADLEAGFAAGVGTLCHVLTGHGSAERASVVAWQTPVLCLDSMQALPSVFMERKGGARAVRGGR